MIIFDANEFVGEAHGRVCRWCFCYVEAAARS
jgi:hypothetical protein